MALCFFSLFVNDIADKVVKSSFYLFAVDLSASPDSFVQDDINSLLLWSNLNGLQFHPTKCKALDFGGHDQPSQFLFGARYLPFVNLLIVRVLLYLVLFLETSC